MGRTCLYLSRFWTMGRIVKDENLQIPTNNLYKKIETVLWDKKTCSVHTTCGGQLTLSFFYVHWPLCVVLKTRLFLPNYLLYREAVNITMLNLSCSIIFQTWQIWRQKICLVGKGLRYYTFKHPSDNQITLAAKSTSK